MQASRTPGRPHPLHAWPRRSPAGLSAGPSAGPSTRGCGRRARGGFGCWHRQPGRKRDEWRGGAWQWWCASTARTAHGPSSGPSSAGVAAAGTTAASVGVATNLVPTWSVAKDQVVFSASQTSRGLEQVVLRERAEDIGFSKTRDMPMLRNGDCVHVIELPGDASFVKVYPRDHAKYPERDYDPGCAGFIRRCWLARLCREQDKINPKAAIDSEVIYPPPDLGSIGEAA